MGQKKYRIFIAEDEPLVLQGFKQIITSQGHEVVGTAMDGKAAASRIAELNPELVIMDINMPLMDGLQVIESINQDIQVPYIIVTGYQDETLLERAAQLGVFGFLTKPVDEYDMKSAVEIVMARFEEFVQLEKELGDTKTALQERKLVERAKWILMDKTKISEPQAMKHLQKLARDRNRRLADIARDIISAEQLFKV